MDLILVFGVSFAFLLVSTARGYFIAYPLFASMLMFFGVMRLRGYSLKSLFRMALRGGQQSFPVIKVLLLIGAVTASWMAAGTVPAIVYYGTQFIHPQYFVLAAFGLTSLVSLLLGTSFGTTGTIGIALMMMAKGSDVNPNLIAGAIIAGAYVGDRCSPMSSSAHLIATITETPIYGNIRRMWQTGIWPLLASLVFYGVWSLLNPVQLVNVEFLNELNRVFQIHPLQLIPALLMLVLSLFQIEVKLAMVLSSLSAIAIAFIHLHHPPLLLLRDLLLGFRLEESSAIANLLLGGGLWSMAKVSLVVILSTAFVGLFSGTNSLHHLEKLLSSPTPSTDSPIRPSTLLQTSLIGLATAAFGCTQTIAILLTRQLVARKYEENGKGNEKLALDLENTVVVLSPLIPWNIAGLVPATLLGTNAGFIPFAVYLYLVPLFNLIDLRMGKSPKFRLCNSLLRKKINY